MNKRQIVTYFALVLMCLLFAGCLETQNNTSDLQPFSIIILPDTQVYSHDRTEWFNCSRKEIFTQMTKWIVANAEELNIKFVMHIGDMVQEHDKPYQWANANEAMSILDGVVPYSLVLGNHDMALDATRNTTNFNKTFPYTRYESEPWFGGRMVDDGYTPANTYDNTYHFFSAAGMDFLVIALEVGPTDAVLAWADGIVSRYPNHRVIITTHSYLFRNDTRDSIGEHLPASHSPSRSGEEIWQKFVKKHKNISFVFSGHFGHSDNHKGLLASTGDHGNTVYQILCGYHLDGWLRILTFVPDKDKIYVKTYSPWQPEDPSDRCNSYPSKHPGYNPDLSLPGYNPDQYHQFELIYDMN